MFNLKKAEEFYLRGFNNEYIKRRTGVSIQQLKNNLKQRGIVYDNSDILNFQIDYIRNKYSVSYIKSEYKRIFERYTDIPKNARNKQIICLGCAFGQFESVFAKLFNSSNNVFVR